MRRIVSLTTDFGRDWYVGAMRGAVLRRCPDAVLADITHDIPPHDVAAGAFALAAACTAFPPGSIHLAVVDPGVGGTRRPLALAAGLDFLVGPDNGLLSLAARALQNARPTSPPTRAVILDPARLGVTRLSATFHGRDLFAPAAGSLAAGATLEDLGEPAPEWMQLAPPLPEASSDTWRLTILYVDSFGNAVTNLRMEDLSDAAWSWRPVEADRPSSQSIRVRHAYDEVAPGDSLLIGGSAGFLEIAVREGRSDQKWGLARGSLVTLVVSASHETK